MASRSAIRVTGKAKLIPIENLFFDVENPRLVELRDFKNQTEDEKALIMWREMAAEEIAISIASNGYYAHEALFAEKLEPNKYVVIEGNRRLAAAKVLLSSELRGRAGVDSLPRISTKTRKELQNLPVIITTREDIWHYVGFKHVNGPRPWGAYSKAQYIAKVHDEYGKSLSDISRQIGDGHSTVRRLYRGLMTLKQAEAKDVFHREDRWTKRFSFSHLYTGLGSVGIQKFLSITEKNSYRADPVPPKKINNLGELCVWLYGSKRDEKRPLIKSQNPDLNSLAEALQSRRGTDALRAGLPLEVAVDAGKGDERILREAMITAKHSLHTAVGTVSTGYDAKSDLLETAKDIADLSEKLRVDMEALRKSKKRLRGRSTR